MKNVKWKIENILKVLCAVFVLGGLLFAQETMPEPSAPRSVKIPAVKEITLKNGLKVAIVERKNVPLVSVQLLIKSGAQNEDNEKAGLADMTASLLTKGTKTRTANQIAEEIAFLGGSINSGANWNSSTVSINVMSDKLNQALAIMSDTVLNPAFKPDEIDLLKSQTLDGLTYNLKQPGFLANYVASKYSFNEHPAGGTPHSINAITQDDITDFHKATYDPKNAVLIFTGDISDAQASNLAQKYFGKWENLAELMQTPKNANGMIEKSKEAIPGRKSKETQQSLLKRILVVDLPNSGQAAVTYAKDLGNVGRTKEDYFFPASVLNSVLGGGYSSRLNQEIRIKRGLSYGAGSSFGWRGTKSNFSTRTQTKNESAAQVAELVLEEVKKLEDGKIADTELGPRKLVLTGTFGRNLETTGGLAGAIADLYSFELSPNELNNYMKSVQAISDAQIQKFAGENLSGGDIIIVGDYAKFKDDLSKRFPNMKVEVIEADKLDLSKESLQK
jgi:zinc protease